MSRAAVSVLALALVIRAAVFLVAENKHGDAPMRALVAERMVLDPASAADPRTYCQFGPLHPTLLRPFLAVDPEAPRSSRYLSLLAGIAVFFPFLALGRRLVGTGPAALAGLVLAVSPLHVQLSTTAASEALYLLLWVTTLERLIAGLATGRIRAFALAGLTGSLAAITRYDAWFALPFVAGAVALFAPLAPGTKIRALVVFTLSAALFPTAWLLFNARQGGDPFFFARYITTDHAQLAADATARYGPLVNRLRQLGIWAAAFAAAMGLPALVVGGRVGLRVLRAPRALSPERRILLVAALGPTAVYLVQGLLLQRFEPLARFAIVPGTLLLPLVAGAVRPARSGAFAAGTLGAAVAFSIAVWAVATVGRDRIWAGAESMGAVTRLDGEDRALAAHLRSRRPSDRSRRSPVMLEPLAFAEIAIAHAARVPWVDAVTLSVRRTPLSTVAESMTRTGARIVAGYDRAGGWPRTLPDWPADGPRFGRWRVAQRSPP